MYTILPSPECTREQLIIRATKQEKIMQRILIELGVPFEFQKVIDYPPTFLVADFYLPLHRAIIEVDGNQHVTNPSIRVRDEEKSQYLKRIGIKSIHIGNRVLTEYQYTSTRRYMDKILRRLRVKQTTL